MPTLAPYKDCTGCMACADSCNRSAIKSILNEEGHLVPSVDPTACVECKLCEKSCPIISKLHYGESERSDAFAAWAKDSALRQRSATAGAFAAIAQYILSNGGVVCGAAIIDGIYVKHILIDTVDDLYKLQGSKYTQSDAKGIYREVYKKLKDGISVLFSGTGCQVAALYGFLRNRPYSGTLLTVDLICGGVPSRFLIDKFIEGEPYQVKRIISFRTKDNGWKPTGFKYNLKVEDNCGNIHDYTGKRDLITDGFSCEMTNRYSCYKCKFAGTHRKSDFTIGDYWGTSDYKEQQHNGISVIIVHNQSALERLKGMTDFLEMHTADIDDILSQNHRLNHGNDNRYKMIERRHLSYFFKQFSYPTLCKIYALQFSNKSPWMIYKAYRYVMSKIYK